MSLELHVWGPAFGLPSVDPECLAAILFAEQSLREGDWALVAAHDVSLSPTKEFPALRDGEKWIGGFHAIVKYLQGHRCEKRNIDSQLSASQLADQAAYASFLRTNALPLLDLNLYTSSTNYYAATAPSFTALLPWNLNYIVPPARRAAARKRTHHLGLQGLDVDSIPDDDSFDAAKRNAGIPAASERPSLLSLNRRRGLKGLLSQPEYAARFKLDALATDCLAPLDELLGDEEEEKDFLLAENNPTSLDCLAFGYLALMLYPELPQPWLFETIKGRFPKVSGYVSRMRKHCLSEEETKPADLMALNDLRGTPKLIAKGRVELGLHLPWSPPAMSTASHAATSIGTTIGSKVPILNQLFTPSPIVPARGQAPYAESSTLLNSLMAVSASLAAILAGAVYYVHQDPRTEDLVFENPAKYSRRPDSFGFADFGSAGSALAALGNQMDIEAKWQRDFQSEREEREGTNSAPLVETSFNYDETPGVTGKPDTVVP